MLPSLQGKKGPVTDNTAMHHIQHITTQINPTFALSRSRPSYLTYILTTVENEQNQVHSVHSPLIDMNSDYVLSLPRLSQITHSDSRGSPQYVCDVQTHV